MDVRVLLLAVILSFNIEVNWSDDKCGHPIGVITTGKIIGGFDVGYFKYPWFVSLVRQDTPYCGGTLITSRHVVTAAHCFKSFIKQKRPDESNLQDVFGIRLGVYNICTSEATQKSFKAKTVDVHERYLKEQPYFDIALLTLSEDAVGFEPCCLPKRDLNSETRPKEGLIQGLGDQKYEATKPTCTVHEARVLIYKDDKCRDMLNSVENNGSALIHAFCAGYLQGGIDACQGDSGGPLIILGDNSQYTLQGITSFGFECAAPKVLGLYTDVSHYLKWLHDRTNGQLNSTQMSTEVGTTIDTTESSPEVSYGDNITETLTEATESSTESSTQTSDSTTTSIDWSIYPVTTFDPATMTLVPDQTTPPDNKKENKEQKLTVIIININRNKHKHVSHLDNGHRSHGRNVRPKRKHIHKKEKKEKRKLLYR